MVRAAAKCGGCTIFDASLQHKIFLNDVSHMVCGQILPAAIEVWRTRAMREITGHAVEMISTRFNAQYLLSLDFSPFQRLLVGPAVVDGEFRHADTGDRPIVEKPERNYFSVSQAASLLNIRNCE
jgi:hypothetical protein